MKATWNGQIIAESDNTVVIEGTHYFPPESIKEEFLSDSSKNTTCPWKGVASYYHIEVDGSVNEDAAWYYPDPKDAANEIKDYLAFWRGVEISS